MVDNRKSASQQVKRAWTWRGELGDEGSKNEEGNERHIMRRKKTRAHRDSHRVVYGKGKPEHQGGAVQWTVWKALKLQSPLHR